MDMACRSGRTRKPLSACLAALQTFRSTTAEWPWPPTKRSQARVRIFPSPFPRSTRAMSSRTETFSSVRMLANGPRALAERIGPPDERNAGRLVLLAFGLLTISSVADGATAYALTPFGVDHMLNGPPTLARRSHHGISRSGVRQPADCSQRQFVENPRRVSTFRFGHYHKPSSQCSVLHRPSDRARIQCRSGGCDDLADSGTWRPVLGISPDHLSNPAGVRSVASVRRGASSRVAEHRRPD